MPATSATSFDVREIPFSYRGSWLNLSPVVGLHTSSDDVHLVSHQTGMHAVLRFEVGRGHAGRTAAPSSLTWTTDDGAVIEAAFESVDTIRVRGTGSALRLADAAAELTPFTGTYLFVDPDRRRRGLHLLRDGPPLSRDRASRATRASTERRRSALARRAVTRRRRRTGRSRSRSSTPRASPYSAQARLRIRALPRPRQQFASFADAIAGWRSDAHPAAELAAYVLWSATVVTARLSRPRVDPHVEALDGQGLELGSLLQRARRRTRGARPRDRPVARTVRSPGCLGRAARFVTHSEVLYNFVKPPIHGWALARLRDDHRARRATRSRSSTTGSRAGRASGSTIAGCRDTRLPHYQHGNDSGWDNSTVFDHDRVIESPDLAAFLVRAARRARRPGRRARNSPTTTGTRTATTIRAGLLAALWDGERFVAVGATSGQPAKTTSLLTLLPIVAAESAAGRVQRRARGGASRHTSPSSGSRPSCPARPSTRTTATGGVRSGLRRRCSSKTAFAASGHIELADEVSARFLALCETSGFAENFDALTGEGLRDRAYTWTASAYLMLARDAELRRASTSTEIGTP